jgi:predicted nucleic acid-binding Zn ribbon protein
MPTYNVECTKCEDKFSTSVTTSYSKLEEILKGGCKKCKGELIQSFKDRKSMTFVLHGVGWTGKIGGSMGSKSALDAALAENDRLAHRNDQDTMRSKDIITETEDLNA